MNHKYQPLSIFFFFFLVYLTTSSNSLAPFLIPTKQHPKEHHHQMLMPLISLTNLEDNQFHEVMGMEICENKDEECLKRRLISEAHLDYIYTQHQTP